MRADLLIDIIGCDLENLHLYQEGGRKVRIGRSGRKAIEALCELYQLSHRKRDIYWAIRARQILPRAENEPARVALNLVIAKTPNLSVLILAVWLRGRCGGSLGTPAIASLTTHTDSQLRKEVARALQRMGAWCELDALKKTDSNDRIRRIAALRSTRPFRDRVQSFATHVSLRPWENRPTKKLFVAEDVVIGAGRPARTREFLRMILLRIRNLVRSTEV